MNMPGKRIGALELRKTLGTGPMFEIIRWSPNPYLGREEEYELIGDVYHHRESKNLMVHKSLFVDPEFCMVIAFIDHGVVDFIGDRALNLASDELKDFIWLLRSGITKSIRWK